MIVAFRCVQHAEKGKGGGIANSLRKDLKNHPQYNTVRIIMQSRFQSFYD